jgi:aspartate kinase
LNDAKDSGELNFADLIADTNVAKISAVGIGMRSQSGVAAKMFQTLSDEGINIKVIATSEIKISVLVDRKYMELAVQSLHDAFELEKALNDAKDAGELKFADLIADTNVAKISAVGIGMRSQSGVAAKMFQTLSDEGINIKVIATSEIKISVLVDRKYMELAVQSLHDAFELEKA